VHQVTPATLRADAQAGLLGAALALPQGIAFAALAGLPPAMGLVAATLPVVVAALVGSSRFVLTGPTNAPALALGAMLAPLALGDPQQMVALALLVTLLVGLMQAVLALARMGTLANFMSSSVMLGFTTGAAALIAWYAAGGLLGGSGRSTPLDVLLPGAGGPALAAVSAPALLVGVATLLFALAGRRWWRQGPYMLVALLLGVAMAWWLSQPGRLAAPQAWPALGQALQALGLGWPAPLVVGSPPSAWPVPTWPVPGLAQLAALLPQLLPIALAMTIITLGQSMAIAKALALRTGDTIDANRECLGQGLANLVSAGSGGMVVSGSLNRSLPNLEAGARTPLAAVASGLFLPLMVALGAPLLAWIPLAGVSALLMLVAWSLWDRAGWGRLWRLDRTEFAIAMSTALATLVLRLEVAVLAGVMLSLVVYLWRTARPALRTMGFDQHGPDRRFVVLDGHPPGALPECPQLKLLRMEGSVWFGAVAHVADHLRALRSRPEVQRHLLVMAKSMNFIDLAAADLWDDERQRRREMGGDLWFHRPRPPVLAMWQRNGFVQRLGPDHILPDKRQAIARIVPLLDPGVCARCQVRLFDECAERPGAPLSPTI
jgi:SulP family sulfate permease